MNSGETVMAGLSTAVLHKNISLGLYSWLDLHPDGETR